MHPPSMLSPFQRAEAQVGVRRIAFPLSHGQTINASISPSCHNPYDSETLNRALRGIHSKLRFPLKTDGLQWSCWSLLLRQISAFRRAHPRSALLTHKQKHRKPQHPANPEWGLQQYCPQILLVFAYSR